MESDLLNIRIISFKVGIADCGRFSFERNGDPVVFSGFLLILIESFHSTLELVIVEGEFSKVNYPQISIADSSKMMKFEFDNLSNETSQNNSTCIFTQCTNPVVLSGLILT
ncbi:unnamed protein product [Schistosoma haematobium]|nr:unnamed protein product [Schistosoma haematobium]